MEDFGLGREAVGELEKIHRRREVGKSAREDEREGNRRAGLEIGLGAVEQGPDVVVDPVLSEEWRRILGERPLDCHRGAEFAAGGDDFEHRQRLQRLGEPNPGRLLRRGELRCLGERREEDVGAPDVGELSAPGDRPLLLDRAEIRLLVIRLVVAQEVDAFAAVRTNDPDFEGDAGAGADEEAGARDADLGRRRVGEEVGLARVVQIEDIEAAAAQGERGEKRRGGIDRE